MQTNGIVIFLNLDSLLCGAVPVPGKFQFLKVSGERDEVPLFFYRAKETGIIHNNAFAQQMFEKGIPGAVGDFYGQVEQNPETALALFANTLDHIKEGWKSVLQAHKSLPGKTIPLSLIFHEAIHEKAKDTLIKFFTENGFELVQNSLSYKALFEALALEQIIEPGNYLYVQDLGAYFRFNLIKATLALQSFQFELTTFLEVKKQDDKQKIRVLADMLVHQAALTWFSPMAGDAKALEKESLRIYDFVQKIIEKEPPHIIKASILLSDGYGGPVVIKREEWEKKCLQNSNYLQFELLAFLNKNKATAEEIRQVIVGDKTLNQQHFFNVLLSVFQSSENILFVEDFYERIMGHMAQVKSHEFLPSYSTPIIDVSKLKSGHRIRLRNFDPSPGKGQSEQILVCLENATFEIIQSSRSLKPGDKAIPLNSVWKKGVQAEFKIVRNGKEIGIFCTRPISEIDVWE